MAKYAYVENDQILGVYDLLPTRWRHISDFRNLANDPDILETFGWKTIVKRTTLDRNDPRRLTVGIKHELVDGVVFEDEYFDPHGRRTQPAINVVDIVYENNVKWNEVRRQRDELMNAFQWRYERYYRNERNGLQQADTLEEMDKYMSELANITLQSNPFNIIWPTYKTQK